MIIHVYWDEFGWVALDLESGRKSTHMAGPRAAADYLCEHMFPKGTWKLHFVAKGRYRLEMLP